MLRVGRIDYINCDPLFLGLEEEGGRGLGIERGVPSVLNARLRAGELDMSPVSSVEYARSAEDYVLVPNTGIAAEGPIRSVLLLSPVPLSELGETTIALSTESATTAVLLRILLDRRWKLRANVIPWNLKDGMPEGPIMVIGDPALKAAATLSHPHAIDLCAEWVAMTGLPMTFALIAIRRDSLEGNGPAIRRVARLFQEAARHWPEGLDRLAPRAASAIGLPLAVVRAYLLALQFHLTDRHLEGLLRFFDLAREVGALERSPSLSFLREDETAEVSTFSTGS